MWEEEEQGEFLQLHSLQQRLVEQRPLLSRAEQTSPATVVVESSWTKVLHRSSWDPRLFEVARIVKTT